MFNFCKHKLGKVQKDGYQYCTKCGKAFVVPCNHTYQLIKEINNKGGGFFGFGADVRPHMTFISRCTKCGDIFSISRE